MAFTLWLRKPQKTKDDGCSTNSRIKRDLSLQMTSEGDERKEGKDGQGPPDEIGTTA